MSSNSFTSHCECCAHDNCLRKHKIIKSDNGLKWSLLVNDKAHSQVIKVTPSRQNRCTVNGTRGQARSVLKDVVRSGNMGTATVETELMTLKIKNNL